MIVEIARPTKEMIAAAERAAASSGCSIVVPSVDFTISCSYKGERVEVKSFSDYVERRIAIPNNINPENVTTGVVIDTDGAIRHVPTSVISDNGRYYAVIKSLTNSTYSAVYNKVEFSDVENHWAKDAVNDMGSRLIISGLGNNRFEPEKCITRAEFAVIIVRALGLAPKTGESCFADVALSDWYCSYVKTAADYGIVNGYDAKYFGPNDLVTREQAMTMTARAMKIAGINFSLAHAETEAILAVYSDRAESSEYAREGIANCLNNGIVSGTSSATLSPKANVTRAEVAVMVWRMLKKSKLI